MAAAQLFDTTKNQTMMSAGGGGIGEAIRTSGTRGGGCLPIVLGGEWSKEKNQIGRAAGPWISMVPTARGDATTNQKLTTSVGYMGEVAQGNNDRGGRHGVFLAIGF
jgi:hypothetical protein